jgi:hypothetical protein
LKVNGDTLENYGSLLLVHGCLLQINCHLMKVRGKVLKLLDIFWNCLMIEYRKALFTRNFMEFYQKYYKRFAKQR